MSAITKLGALALSLFCAPVFAQQTPQSGLPPASEEADEVVVVRGSKLPESIQGDVRPEQTISTFELRMSGATNLAETLATLLPQTTSARQRNGAKPILLINARRVSNFAEIRFIPTRAIRRIEIYPEEVALRYGFPADQKVVNIILVGKFNLGDAGIGFESSAQGERLATTASASKTIITTAGRSVYNLETSLAPNVSEADLVGSTLNPNRSVLPETNSYRLTAALGRDMTKHFGEMGYGTLGIDLERKLTNRRLITTSLGETLRTKTDQIDATLSLNAEGFAGQGRWSVISLFDAESSKSQSDRGASLGRDKASFDAHAASLEGNFSTPFFQMPAGPATVSVNAKLEAGERQSDWLRSRAAGSSTSERTRSSVSGSLSLPVTSARKKVLDQFGDLTVTINGGLSSATNFGGAGQWGAGLTWRPISDLTATLRYDDSESLPTLEQLGDPLSTLPGALFYDARTGISRSIAITTGGNALLRSEKHSDKSLDLSFAPSQVEGLTLSASYSQNQTRDAIGTVGYNTAALESLAVGRFMRDTSGALVGFDSRAFNLGARETTKVGLGISFGRSFGQAPAFLREGVERLRAAQEANPDGPLLDANGLPIGFKPPAGMRPPPGGAPPDINEILKMAKLPGGRWQVALSYAYTLDDTLASATGGRKLDLLAGDALNTDTGYRHALTLESSVNYRGMGARLYGTWKGESEVRTGYSNGILRVEDQVALNLSASMMFDMRPELMMALPMLRGARIGVDITNLTDEAIKITDGAGLRPAAFDGSLLNPEGRAIKLTFRKQF